MESETEVSDSSTWTQSSLNLSDPAQSSWEVHESMQGNFSVQTHFDLKAYRQNPTEYFQKLVSGLSKRLMVHSQSHPERHMNRTKKKPSNSDHRTKQQSTDPHAERQRQLKDFHHAREESQLARKIRQTESISSSEAGSFGICDEIANKDEEEKRYLATQSLKALRDNQIKLNQGVTKAKDKITEIRLSMEPVQAGRIVVKMSDNKKKEKLSQAEQYLGEVERHLSENPYMFSRLKKCI